MCTIMCIPLPLPTQPDTHWSNNVNKHKNSKQMLLNPSIMRYGWRQTTQTLWPSSKATALSWKRQLCSCDSTTNFSFPWRNKQSWLPSVPFLFNAECGRDFLEWNSTHSGPGGPRPSSIHWKRTSNSTAKDDCAFSFGQYLTWSNCPLRDRKENIFLPQWKASILVFHIFKADFMGMWVASRDLSTVPHLCTALAQNLVYGMDIRLKEEPSWNCVYSLTSLLIKWARPRNFWTWTPLATEDLAENGGRESARSLTASHVIVCSGSRLQTLENNACNSSDSLGPFMAFLTLSFPLTDPLSQPCLVALLSWDDYSQGLLFCF